MVKSEIAVSEKLASEYVQKALDATNDGLSEIAGRYYMAALEEIGRCKMLHENLGEILANAPSESTIKVDGRRVSARDARIQVAIHFLTEHSIANAVKQENDTFSFDAFATRSISALKDSLGLLYGFL